MRLSKRVRYWFSIKVTDKHAFKFSLPIRKISVQLFSFRHFDKPPSLGFPFKVCCCSAILLLKSVIVKLDSWFEPKSCESFRPSVYRGRKNYAYTNAHFFITASVLKAPANSVYLYVFSRYSDISLKNLNLISLLHLDKKSVESSFVLVSNNL